MIWIRWSLPRLRVDQVMTTCLKYCVPIASAMLVGVMLWCYFLPGGLMVRTGDGGGCRKRQPFDDIRSTTSSVPFASRSMGGPEMIGSVNWHSFFFLLLALIACSFAVAVVVTRQHRAHGVLS